MAKEEDEDQALTRRDFTNPVPSTAQHQRIARFHVDPCSRGVTTVALPLKVVSAAHQATAGETSVRCTLPVGTGTGAGKEEKGKEGRR